MQVLYWTKRISMIVLWYLTRWGFIPEPVFGPLGTGRWLPLVMKPQVLACWANMIVAGLAGRDPFSAVASWSGPGVGS